MSDLGCRLRGFVLEHPCPATVAALYADLVIRNPPELREGPRIRFTATVDTPLGVATLS